LPGLSRDVVNANGRRICAIKCDFSRKHSNTAPALNSIARNTRFPANFPGDFCPIHGLGCPAAAFFLPSKNKKNTFALTTLANVFAGHP
jgi:hypothetical protein